MSADIRSVGELLVANDLTARRVLMDTDQLDAGSMVRAWPELAAAADRFWSSLPSRGVEAGPRKDAALIRQTVAMNGASPSMLALWQSRGSPDMRVIEMAKNLNRGAQLLQGYGRAPGIPLSAPAAADLAAAETRALHALYVTAHGVNLALRNEQHVLAASEIKRHSPRPHESPMLVERMQHRFANVEEVLAVHLGRRWPAALEGEHREQPGLERLQDALARWEVHAQRAASDAPSASSLYIMCNTQAALVGNGHALVRAAALYEHMDPLEYRDRFAPALERAAAQFRAAGDSWRNMASPGALTPDDKALHTYSQEARAAMYELVRDGSMLASPETLVRRADPREVTQTIRQTLAVSAELAQGIRDAARSADLTAPARWVHQATTAAHARLEAPNAEPSPMTAWVSPNALRRNDPVKLPELLKDGIAGQMNDVVTAATSVREAAANVLDRGVNGQAAQERGIPTPTAAMRPPTW